MSGSFAALQSRGGAAAGGKGERKRFAFMQPDEKEAYLKKKRADEIKAAMDAHKDASASSSRGKIPVPMWEADVAKLTRVVDGDGTLKVMYNHGTAESPDLREECYVTPLCHVTKTTMLYGAGTKFEDKTDPNPKPPGPKDWAYMMAVQIGLPYPSDIDSINAKALEEQTKSIEFLRARNKFIIAQPIEDKRIYPGLRAKEEEDVAERKQEALDDKKEFTPLMEQRTRQTYWRKAINRGIDVINEKTESGQEIEFFEINLKSGTFFMDKSPKKEACPAEVDDVLANATEESKIMHARAFKDAYAQGYRHAPIRVYDLDDNLIMTSIFKKPLHDGDLVIVCITGSWYQKGINRGCSNHPARVALVRDTRRSSTFVKMNTTVYAQHVRRRTPLEVNVLTKIKACTAEDGLELTDLITALGDSVDTTKLTNAITALIKHEFVRNGKSKMHFALVDKNLNIAALPVEEEEEEEGTDFAMIVEKARANVEKKKAAEAEAAAKKKKDEEEEAAKKANVAQATTAVATGLGAIVPAAQTPRTSTAVASMVAEAKKKDEDDEDDDRPVHAAPVAETPAAKRQKRDK